MIDIALLVRQYSSATEKPVFLSIDGHAGSGKSTLATLISHRLQAAIIKTDDFATPENPLAYCTQLEAHIFQPIKEGATQLSYERSRWWPNHQPQPVIDQPVTKVMILEGVGSSQKALRTHLAFGIFVDTPQGICQRRGISRDLKANAATRREIISNWRTWIADEQLYFHDNNPEQYAEVTVDGTRPFEEQIVGAL